MALVALTASQAVLGALPGTVTFRLALARGTATANDDGTWTVTAQTAEANIGALSNLGCVVRVVTSDAEQLARWQALESQIDDQPPVA